jgi:hypothetical protein
MIERMALCLHLLRLRPTADQLAEWYGSNDATEVKEKYAREGWTEFLKQMTPTDVFAGLDCSYDEKRRRRMAIMEQMWNVAKLEEQCKNGEIGMCSDHVPWDIPS